MTTRKAAKPPLGSRRVEYLPLDEVQPHPQNPRAHESLGDVDDSIDDLGFIEPIVRDERTGQLIAGHGRQLVLAAKRDAGEEPPDGVVLDGDGRWLVPVVVGWSSRDDAAATRARITLNRTAETGGWDDALLLKQLDDLANGPTGLKASGYDAAALQALRELVEGLDLQPPDEFPEPGLDTDRQCPKCGYRWAQ